MEQDAFFEFVDEYEKVVLNDFDTAELILNKQFFRVKKIDDKQLIEQYLTFFSQVTGDAEGFTRLSALLQYFKNKNLILEEQVQQYLEDTPCNRWL